MKTMLKAFVCASVLSASLMFGTASCSMENDYHQSKDEQWLIEQVEQGYLTQEQADAIREQQKNPK